MITWVSVHAAINVARFIDLHIPRDKGIEGLASICIPGVCRCALYLMHGHSGFFPSRINGALVDASKIGFPLAISADARQKTDRLARRKQAFDFKGCFDDLLGIHDSLSRSSLLMIHSNA